MNSVIKPTRLFADNRFSVVGFTIRTFGEGKRYEVAVASDVSLFRPDAKPRRTQANFYSSRAAGLQPVERGEAVYLVPPEVLARFVGQERLYYALATYSDGNGTVAEIPAVPSEGSAYIDLKGLSGDSLKRIRVLPSRQRAAYGNSGGSALEWAGDAAAPGSQPVRDVPERETTAALSPQSASAALDYNDGFGLLPPSPVAHAEPRPAPRARAQSAECFSINWDAVEVIAQPTNLSCWATSAAMVLGWRDRASLTPEYVASLGARAMQNVLPFGEYPQFAREVGLVSEPPQSYSIDAFRDMLDRFGPLWVTKIDPGVHVVVVTGMYSDGAPDGSDTYVRITDPWDRVTGTPGTRGAYLPTHNTGSRYILSWADFIAEYEEAARVPNVNLQILHAADTGGREPRRSGAAGYAMSATVARAQNAVATLNWDDVELIPQPTGVTCWAAAGAMVIGWRDRVSLTPETVAAIAGRSTATGLSVNECRRFAAEMGLVPEGPASYTPAGLRTLLENYGPLWVTVQLPGSGHAIVVTGMYGDDAPDGSATYVRISDPWDRVVGTPGAPGTYLSTHDTGSRYILNWVDFTSEYELFATSGPDGSVNVQILHAEGTDGRTPNRGRAAGYAMGARALDGATDQDEDSAHGIDGAIPDGPEAPSAPALASALSGDSEYPQASRFAPAAASNYRVSRGTRTIERVVIHITDGRENINGPISWFQNPAARVSAHYIVGRDGEVVQMVRHDDVAWHASSANGNSIGIEHVANQGERGLPRLMPTDAEYCASAALTRWLCDTYSIPIDRTHVLGHSEADPRTTHTDCPNAVWDWDYFMGMVVSGVCAPRSQTQTLSSDPGRGRASVELPAPPPPIVRAWAKDVKSEVISVIAGAVMERIVNSDGGITWELDQLRGLKHPNDIPPSPAPAFHDAPIIRLDHWPSVKVLHVDRLSAWFTVDWQFNGKSVGNVRITNVGTEGSMIGRLQVSARIMDDNILYPPQQPSFAALRIRFHYRFSAPTDSDDIAIVDLHLYGDGTFEKTSRWEQ
jgi:N-acetyl-anhydromuramyl-L-alanine amidase AmpD